MILIGILPIPGITCCVYILVSDIKLFISIMIRAILNFIRKIKPKNVLHLQNKFMLEKNYCILKITDDDPNSTFQFVFVSLM
jgi:hypothetical protein